MKKRLILILNGKGGVGKSFFAVNFVQYLKDHEISHAAFDSDDENSTLKRFHSEAQFIDAGQPTEIDKVTFALADSDIVVVDCRAASTRIFLNYFEETRLPDILEKLGARLTIACPVNHELDSIYQIQKLVNAIGGKVDFVIIRNEVHGEGFDLFDKSKLRQKLLNDLGAKEIQVTQMRKWLVEGLQKSKLTVTAAKANEDFSFMDRQRLKLWQETFYAQIETVKEFLLPTDAAQPKN
jgi:MinD-like ATPase involved in chromosome partitioning or flagellar assembly